MKKLPGAIGIIVLALLVITAGWMARATAAVDLGSAEDFAILAGTTITNTGPTTITGDVGLHPGSAITGFGSVVQNGTVHAADAVAAQAKADLSIAYDEAVASTPVTTIGTELGGQVLTPGTYNSASGTFEVTGILTLDAQNDPDAVFIFQTASTLVTASASSVILINAADVCNVVWQVGSSATFGTTTAFKGSVLALTSITLTTGVQIDGRVLAQNGAVTMDTNTVTSGPCVPAPTATPTEVPTPTPTEIPTPTPTAVPTPTPTAVPTPTPTAVPTATPTATPTTVPTPTPTVVTTATPTATPTDVPTPTPTVVPPTAAPTATPVLPVATSTITPVLIALPTPPAPTGIVITTILTSPVPTLAPTPGIDLVRLEASPSPSAEVALDGGPGLPATGAPIRTLIVVALGLITCGEILRRKTRTSH